MITTPPPEVVVQVETVLETALEVAIALIALVVEIVLVAPIRLAMMSLKFNATLSDAKTLQETTFGTGLANQQTMVPVQEIQQIQPTANQLMMAPAQLPPLVKL